MIGEIDAPVRKLVAALNDLPGIVTFSSCGGHAEQTNVSQVPAGHFYVAFEADPLGGGWYSLEAVGFAAGQFEGGQGGRVVQRRRAR